MTGIQIVLISGLLGIAAYYTFRVRNAFFDLLLITLFFSAAVFIIMKPDLTNIAAAKLGVGRGADLLFYLFILFFLFIVLKLLARIRRMEKTLTNLVREQAKEKGQYLQS